MDELNQENRDGEMTVSAYVPPLEYTKGQPEPIAAKGGLSYMAFDKDGDAGTAKATQAAIELVDNGSGQAVIDMIENAVPGPIETQWGLGFRTADECLKYIDEQGMSAPEGGVVVPLRYSVHEEETYSIVSSNALWHDPSQKNLAERLHHEERNQGRRNLFFPQVLRDARRIGEYHPGLSPHSPECMDKLGVSLVHCESECQNFYDCLLYTSPSPRD